MATEGNPKPLRYTVRDEGRQCDVESWGEGECAWHWRGKDTNTEGEEAQLASTLPSNGLAVQNPSCDVYLIRKICTRSSSLKNSSNRTAVGNLMTISVSHCC